MKRHTLEDKEIAAKLKCVLDCCIYPQTCRWNERCMEEGMRASKEAKTSREKAIRGDPKHENSN